MPPPQSSREPELDSLSIIEPLCAVFRRTLKAAKLKYTPERARILDAIIAMPQAFTAEDLIAKLRGPGSPIRVSKATAYRTIKLLLDAGIIQQLPLVGEQASYQLAYGQRSSGLLVRVDTHEATSVDVPELARIVDRLCAQNNLAPEGFRLVIYAKGGR